MYLKDKLNYKLINYLINDHDLIYYNFINYYNFYVNWIFIFLYEKTRDPASTVIIIIIIIII